MNNRLGLFGCSLFLLATLAACGGGSSNGGPSTAPPINTTGNSGGSGSAPPPNNSGSAPPPTTTSGSRFAYVAGNLGISAYSVNSDDGKLSEITGSPFAPATPFEPGTRPRSVDVDPSDHFVYSTDGRGVHAYSIDRASGALSEITGSPFAADGGALGEVLVHPSGQFVYALGTGLGIWAYRVAATGALSQVEGSPFSVGGLNAIAIVPSGEYATVTNCFSSGLFTLKIDLATGALASPNTSANAGQHPCDVAVDPSGNFVFVPTDGGAGGTDGVYSFRIDPATGTLTQIGLVAAGASPNLVAVHPTGKFAYVANYISDDVSIFRIDAAGTLTSIGAAVPTGDQPRSITVDPSGHFAYVTGDTGTISGYRIDANTGALTEIDGSPLATMNLPSSMTITGNL